MRRPFDTYEVILCDLDGCLIAGERVLPGAQKLVRRFRDRLWLLSNNSTDTPATLVRRLEQLGLEVSADRIVLAGTVAIDALVQRGMRQRVSIFGSAALREYAIGRGLMIDDAHPECIVLARDLSFDFAALTRLVRHLADGVEFVVTNEDATHPGADGRPVPETGALLAAVRTCWPRVTYTCFGKPHATMYDHVLGRSGLTRADALAVGDNPATDGRGAAAAGIDFALVGCLSDRFPNLAALAP